MTMMIFKIFEMSCFVINAEKNDDFERILSLMMVPIKGYDESTNTYYIHVTYKLWSYIKRECGFRDVTVLPKKLRVVNEEIYKAFKAEMKASRNNKK